MIFMLDLTCPGPIFINEKDQIGNIFIPDDLVIIPSQLIHHFLRNRVKTHSPTKILSLAVSLSLCYFKEVGYL